MESTITQIVFTISPIINALSDTLRTVHTPHAVRPPPRSPTPWLSS
ncbi:hypothetical protein HMPREF0742_01669 [Rothia aeria F0184]|uniref:Uncharacterized protein n=2 Tax=Rothia aeria TaxID=172042 RepID=U7V2L3_9MICC|nr:hypothetical protein HMPREF1324_2029 [Rothia aeria F0474]ERT65751.1 hypothetical protein HMPREF0742_01669 [Rothia aeria F0184]